jgi:surface protein
MSNKTFKLNINLLSSLAIISLLLFNACSKDDDNDGDTILSGKLIDSAIEGVRYETNSGITGYTNKNGTFTYKKTDKKITFTIGSLIISKFTLSKLNSDGKILPSDIVGVDRNNTTNEKLVRLIRLLQSLDNDNNPDNGIFIDDNTKGYLSEEIIGAGAINLETIVKIAKKTLRNKKTSRMHYIKTLKSMNIDPELMTFNTIWETTSNYEDIIIFIDTDYKSNYNYTLDWGDGTITKNIKYSISHTYSNKGSYTLKISGEFPAIKTSSKKLQKITQWGDIAWSSFKYSFFDCSNLDVNATDTPDLSNVYFTSYMFNKTHNLKGNKHFNDWDVSNVIYMDHMFDDAKVFNQPLNNWDVSKVTDMSSIFENAVAFNQTLNNWNVSSVTDMYAMFGNAKAFNQPLNRWDVSNVTDMSSMFYGTQAFNQALNNWNVGKVTITKYMFYQTDAFNQPLNNWNVRNVTNMHKMFNEANAFTNQDLSSWNVANVASYRHGDFMTDSGGGNTQPTW